jgi:hypothetical protein
MPGGFWRYPRLIHCPESACENPCQFVLPAGRGTTPPLIVFDAVLVFNDYEQDRKDASQRVRNRAQHSPGARCQMQRMTGGLQVLTLTNAPDATSTISVQWHPAFVQYGPDGVVLVADREGRQLPPVTPDTVLACATTAKSSKRCLRPESILFKSVHRRGQEAADHDGEVPVFRDGDVVTTFQPADLASRPSSKAASQRGPDDPIFDGKGVNFARILNPHETIGKRIAIAMPRCFAGPQPCRRYRSKAYR